MKCPVCLKKDATSSHHVIPRKIGGTDDSRNIIKVCRRCHDRLEEYAEIGVYYSPQLVEMLRLEKEPEIRIVINPQLTSGVLQKPIEWLPTEMFFKKKERRVQLPNTDFIYESVERTGYSGRPPKVGKVHRTTIWRRKRRYLQVLLEDKQKQVVLL